MQPLLLVCSNLRATCAGHRTAGTREVASPASVPARQVHATAHPLQLLLLLNARAVRHLRRAGAVGAALPLALRLGGRVEPAAEPDLAEPALAELLLRHVDGRAPDLHLRATVGPTVVHDHRLRARRARREA